MALRCGLLRIMLCYVSFILPGITRVAYMMPSESDSTANVEISPERVPRHHNKAAVGLSSNLAAGFC
jgi:hypothetical protein